MARELRVKVTGESSGAIVALQETQSAIKKLGSEAVTSVGQSKAEFSSLLDTIEKTSPELAGLSKAAFNAGLALDKVGDAKGISAYTAKLVEAQTRVDQYAERLAAAERAGVDLGEKPAAALARMREGVERLAEHLVNLRDTTAESQAKIAALTDGGEQGMSDLAKAADAARAATQELSSVEGPEQLEGALKRGAWASLQLREELARATAAGEKIDDATVSALKAVESQTQSSIDKMSRFRKEMADAGEVSKLGADKLDAAKNAAGGLGNVFDKLEKSSNATAASIGKVGVGLGVAGAAITGAIAAGKELADGIDKLSEKYAKLQQKQIDQKIRLQEQDIATRAADRGLIEHGKTIADTVENYNRFAVAQGKLSEGGRRFIETVAGLKVPPTFEDLSKRVDAIGIAFEGAYKRSKEYGDRFLLDNAAELKELAQRYSDLGQQVPETLQKLIDKLEAMAAAGKSTAAGVGQAAEKVMTLAEAAAQAGPSLDGMRERIMDAAKASDVAAAINAKYRDQLKDTTPVVNEFGRNAFDQSRWDENTRDINASVAAIKAQDQALQDGMDAWAVAGQAMGKFSVDVRQATKDYVDTGDAALDLIERMARANDKLGDLSVFAGSWIAELEKGNITTGEFRQKLDELSVGLPYYSALLRAAGVDAKDTQQALSEMYRALNDIGPQWSEFFKKRDAAIAKSRDEWRKLQDEIKKTGDAATVAAGLVDKVTGGARGTSSAKELADALLDELEKRRNIR